MQTRTRSALKNVLQLQMVLSQKLWQERRYVSGVDGVFAVIVENVLRDNPAFFFIKAYNFGDRRNHSLTIWETAELNDYIERCGNLAADGGHWHVDGHQHHRFESQNEFLWRVCMSRRHA